MGLSLGPLHFLMRGAPCYILGVLYMYPSPCGCEWVGGSSPPTVFRSWLKVCTTRTHTAPQYVPKADEVEELWGPYHGGRRKGAMQPETWDMYTYIYIYKYVFLYIYLLYIQGYMDICRFGNMHTNPFRLVQSPFGESMFRVFTF